MKCNEYPLYDGKSKILATDAMSAGLSVSYYNSGAPKNAHNGYRFFLSTDGEYVDFFRGDHLSHCKTLTEARIFLSGFVAGRKAAYQSKPA